MCLVDNFLKVEVVTGIGAEDDIGNFVWIQ